MEVLSAPICGFFTSMSVKDCKKALSGDSIEWDNEGVRILSGYFPAVRTTLSIRESTCILEMLWEIRGERILQGNSGFQRGG